MLQLGFYNIFVNGLFPFPEETFLINSADYNTLSARNAIYKVEKTLSNHLGIIGNQFYVKIMVPNLKKTATTYLSETVFKTSYSTKESYKTVVKRTYYT